LTLPGPRRRVFVALTLGLACAAVLGIPELILRAVDPPLGGFRAMDFGGDPSTPLLFVEDPLYRWRLRPDTEVEFLGALVRTDSLGLRGPEPRPGARRVLCVGDSTTFGWRVAEAETFPARLEALLAGGGEDRQVLNAGVPGYSSFQAALAAEELLPRLDPQVLIVLVGNNDGWPAARSDRQLHEDGRARAWVVRALSASRTLVWLKEALAPGEPRDFRPFGLQDAGPRVGREEFVENVRRMISLARERGARVVVVSPPVNFYHQPLRLEDFLPDPAAARGEWEEVWEYARRDDVDEALRRVATSLAASPERTDLLWLRGMLLSQAGRLAEGRAALEEAVERHPYPERIKPSYRRALADLAREENAEFLDAEEVLRAASPAGEPMRLYQDWCHPTAEGHRVLARALADLLGAHFVGSGRSASRASPRASPWATSAWPARSSPRGR
jgi:lysophospholipase L1-like esterase